MRYTAVKDSFENTLEYYKDVESKQLLWELGQDGNSIKNDNLIEMFLGKTICLRKQ